MSRDGTETLRGDRDRRRESPSSRRDDRSKAGDGAKTLRGDRDRRRESPPQDDLDAIKEFLDRMTPNWLPRATPGVQGHSHSSLRLTRPLRDNARTARALCSE